MSRTPTIARPATVRAISVASPSVALACAARAARFENRESARLLPAPASNHQPQDPDRGPCGGAERSGIGCRCSPPTA